MNKTCKDCIHYDACKDMYDGSKEDFDDKADDVCCEFFKDKDRFIELPCAVGNDVYYLYNIDEPNRVYCGRLVSFSFDSSGLWFNCHYKCGFNMWHYIKDFGKTVFLTKWDAEKALSKELDYVEVKSLDIESSEFKRAIETLKRL